MKRTCLLISLLALTACQSTTAHQGQYRQALSDTQVVSDVHSDPTRAKSPAIPDDVELSAEDRKAAQASRYKLANLKPGTRPAADTEEAGLWLMVDRIEEELKTSPKLIRDPALNAYIQDVTCRVAGAYCSSLRVYVVDSPYFNASMMPNGVMQIHTGLLLRVHNEAQLATVIAHELGHFLRRHSYEKMLEVRRNAAMAAILNTILSGITAQPGQLMILNDAGVKNTAYRNDLPYNRKREREADGYGLVLMQAAGYDPREAAKIWWNIQRETLAGHEDGEGASSSYNSTHPTSKERYKVLKLLGEELATQSKQQGKKLTIGAERYAAAVSPIRAKLLQDELSVGDFDSSREAFSIVLEKGMDRGTVLFFLGELYRQRGKEDDLPRAIKIYDQAALFTEHPTDLYRSRGLVHWKLGQKTKARADFVRYLDLNPGAADAAMIATMLN